MFKRVHRIFCGHRFKPITQHCNSHVQMSSWVTETWHQARTAFTTKNKTSLNGCKINHEIRRSGILFSTWQSLQAVVASGLYGVASNIEIKPQLNGRQDFLHAFNAPFHYKFTYLLKYTRHPNSPAQVSLLYFMKAIISLDFEFIHLSTDRLSECTLTSISERQSRAIWLIFDQNTEPTAQFAEYLHILYANSRVAFDWKWRTSLDALTLG